MSALSTTARREYYSEIGNSLPPPVLHNQEYHDRRHTTGVEAFEALRPADANEARLAVDIVLSGAHAAECLREAGVYREDYAKRTRCRAQAASMMREQRAFRRSLAQEQKMRLAREAVANAERTQPAVANSAPEEAAPPQAPPPPVLAVPVAPPPVQATVTEVQSVQAAVVAPEPVLPAAAAPLSVQTAPAMPPPVQPSDVALPPVAGTSPPAHASQAVAPPSPAASGSAPPPPAATGTAPPSAPAGSALPPAPAGSAPPPSSEAIAMAEAYVEENIVAAAQIRHDGGVTPQSTAYFRHLTLPSDPALIDALVRGASSTLTLLDDIGDETLDAAA